MSDFSCFSCMGRCDGGDIAEYIDGGTVPLCPMCGTDSLAEGDLPDDELEALFEANFGGENGMSVSEMVDVSQRLDEDSFDGEGEEDEN